MNENLWLIGDIHLWKLFLIIKVSSKLYYSIYVPLYASLIQYTKRDYLTCGRSLTFSVSKQIVFITFDLVVMHAYLRSIDASTIGKGHSLSTSSRWWWNHINISNHNRKSFEVMPCTSLLANIWAMIIICERHERVCIECCKANCEISWQSVEDIITSICFVLNHSGPIKLFYWLIPWDLKQRPRTRPRLGLGIQSTLKGKCLI